MESFYEIAKLVEQDRLEEKRRKRYSLAEKVDQTRNIFSAWCRTKHLNKENYSAFCYYVNKYNVNFWVAKAILETDYNISFTFDYNTELWNIRSADGNVLHINIQKRK